MVRLAAAGFMKQQALISDWNSFKKDMSGWLTDEEMWMNALAVLLKIIIIIVISRIVIRVVRKMVTRMVIEREKHPIKFDPRRTKTIGRLINNLVSYTVNFIMFLLILSQMGFDLMPLLAGAGIVGLAIGFGAQSLVKDVITGFFIIFEDQFAVGDVVQTGTFKGTVEEIGLRVTRIRSWTGEVHIIPNGAITEVTNFSINNSVAVVDVSIAYEADINKATEVMKETVAIVAQENEDIVKAPEVLGVQMLGPSEVVIRVTAECKPNTQFAVSRQLNAEVKRALDEHGIEIPYPRVVTYHRSEKAEV